MVIDQENNRPLTAEEIELLEIKPSDSAITKYAKTMFKSIKTDGYLKVEVKGDVCTIAIS